MPILAIGVSHRRAPVELLERLSIPTEDLAKAYRRLTDRDTVSEAVILSTCNRVEVYAEVPSFHAGQLALKRFLAESGELDQETVAEPLYSHYEDQVAEHLFAVAAGMDSMVLGEPQILSQVRQAFRSAQAEGAVGPALAPLFRAAVRAGRRVRANTAIGAAPEAMVAAGLDIAERVIGGSRGLAGRSAAVVGAGQMATIAVRVLKERGVGRIRVANRSPERARALAERHGAEPHGLDTLGRALEGADLLVACTGAAGAVVGIADVLAAMAGPAGAPKMFVLDLAVPRDVDAAVGELSGVTLVDVDDLATAVERGSEVREAVRAGAAIVGDEVARFAAWRRSARLAPLIEALRRRADGIRDGELSKTLAKLDDLTPAQRQAVEAMSRAIVAKLLHEPIVRVKDLTGPGAGDQRARALAELFGLEFPPGP